MVLLDNVTYPTTIDPASCEGFAVQTAPDCAWRAAEVALGPGGTTLQLTAPLNGTGTSVVATRGYFANWPLVTV